MNAAQVRAKARIVVKKREEQVEADELEAGELNLVPYLDIVTNILLFLLASISAGIMFGHINTSLPDHAPAATGPQPPQVEPNDKPLQLVVSVTRSELRVWSISGLEGDIKTPKAIIPKTAPGADQDYEVGKLTDELAGIVNRRWPDAAARAPETRQIILQADAEIRYSTIIHIMDAIREKVTIPDPNQPTQKQVLVLFPDVHFASGFE
jgi:biopolymer transport protein ExbD